MYACAQDREREGGVRHRDGGGGQDLRFERPLHVHVVSDLSVHRISSVCVCAVCAVCSLTLCNPRDCSPPGSSVHRVSPGENAGVCCHTLLQGIFPTQGSNPRLLHCKRILYHLSHQGSPRILEWVAYPSSRGSSWPRNRTGISCIASGFFTSWATREAPESVLLFLNTSLTRNQTEESSNCWQRALGLEWALEWGGPEWGS